MKEPSDLDLLLRELLRKEIAEADPAQDAFFTTFLLLVPAMLGGAWLLGYVILPYLFPGWGS